ncbi:plasmid p 4b orf-3 family protein [Corynascus novoguineensis]|uniref:Plasmid p 4b orf-3 family protein n=1 Tax=Corynascus novoguineensis TaxID=1126955 RepID=A0AAN7HHQ0_9PEZI|nr:plasmid p 4b orf-3 family protein [Corynascus novoguineensis]
MTTSQKCDNPSCPQAAADSPISSNNLRLCSRCRATRYCSQECQRACWPSHKRRCRRQNYIIKFQLCPEDIADPPVERTLSCPADAPFYLLHLALQTAFGWATTHSFDFAVRDPDYRPPTDIADFLRNRLVYRDGGADRPREYLLRVVDPVPRSPFSGIDRMHEGSRQHPGTVEKKSNEWCLWQLLDDRQYQGKQLLYTYDFGDNWEHVSTVEGRAEATDHFVCLSGTGHPVAEDAGGVAGWNDLKAAYRTERPTAEQRERRAWFETRASNADPAGLAGDRVHAWDKAQVNRNLENLLERFEQIAEQAASQKAMFEQIIGRS